MVKAAKVNLLPPQLLYSIHYQQQETYRIFTAITTSNQCLRESAPGVDELEANETTKLKKDNSTWFIMLSSVS